MKKKIIILSLICFVLFLGFSTSNVYSSTENWSFPDEWLESPTASELGIDEFSESDILIEKVESGNLPPVEERLPVDPPVRAPYESVGEYGGTFRVASTGVDVYHEMTHARVPNLFTNDPGASEVIPEIAEGYEFKDDSTRLVIYLREGLKWSDGEPFTTDDIMFWYESEILHDDITIWARSFWEVEGEFPEVKQVDEYTVEFIFPEPFRPTEGLLNYWTAQQNNLFVPAHYLKKYHIDHNENVEELVEKDDDYDTWLDQYYGRREVHSSYRYPEMPVLGPWKLVERSSSRRVLERNPYYFMVDTEGNQLPYLDEIVVDIYSDVEVAILDAMQGNLDLAAMILRSSEFPMYVQNETQGDYSTFRYRSGNVSEVTYALNLNHPDEAKNELFNDVRFRQALSLAIDRHEINEFVYLGLGDPRQFTIDPSASYYKEEWGEAFAEYDPERAIDLIEEIGLEKGSDGYYKLPNGEDLIIELRVPSGSDTGTVGMDEVNELVSDYWNEIGVRTEFEMVSRELYTSQTSETEHDIAVWHADRMEELRAYLPGLAPIHLSGNLQYGNEWARWKNYQEWLDRDKTGEEPASEGVEPPEYIKDYMDLVDSWYTAQTDEEYLQIAEEIFDFHSENLFVIGTVAKALRPVIINNRVNNVPEQLPFSDGTSFMRIARPDQWYIGD